MCGYVCFFIYIKSDSYESFSSNRKPFAKVAVDGIRKEVEAAGYELALLEKYTEKAQLLEAVKDANAIIIRSDVIDNEVFDLLPN